MTNERQSMDERPRRAPRPDLERGRAALRVVLPVNEQIGAWQSAVARLGSIGARGHASAGDMARYREELETLRLAVSRQKQSLAEALAALPAGVAQHSRTRDTLRALESLATGIERAEVLLKP